MRIYITGEVAHFFKRTCPAEQFSMTSNRKVLTLLVSRTFDARLYELYFKLLWGIRWQRNFLRIKLLPKEGQDGTRRWGTMKYF